MIQVYEEAVAALKRIQTTFTDTSSLVVVIQGGMVGAVCSNDGSRIGQGYDVIDYDTDGADPADLGRVRQSDGRIARGYISGGYIEELQVEILDEESADAE